MLYSFILSYLIVSTKLFLYKTYLSIVKLHENNIFGKERIDVWRERIVFIKTQYATNCIFKLNPN